MSNHEASRGLLDRMRSWLRRNFGVQAPRPLPILLEDLYERPAQVAYRGARDWEDSLTTLLGEEFPEREDLGVEVRHLARQLRGLLLLLQRAKHLYESLGDGPMTVTEVRDVSLELRDAVEDLIGRTAPLLGKGVRPRSRDLLQIVEAARRLQRRVDAYHAVLRAGLAEAPAFPSRLTGGPG